MHSSSLASIALLDTYAYENPQIHALRSNEACPRSCLQGCRLCLLRRPRFQRSERMQSNYVNPGLSRILIGGCPLLVGIQTTFGGNTPLIMGRVYQSCVNLTVVWPCAAKAVELCCLLATLWASKVFEQSTANMCWRQQRLLDVREACETPMISCSLFPARDVEHHAKHIFLCQSRVLLKHWQQQRLMSTFC